MANGLFPTITKDKPSKSRILELVRVGLYTFCFIGIIVHFNEHENVIYETSKAAQRDIAMLFFVGIMFVMQKIRLINWQSLLVTIVFAPFAVLGVLRFSQSPDLIPPAIMEQIAFWLELLLITDMVITKRVRKPKDMNWTMLLFLGSVIVILLTMRAQGNSAPATFLAFLLFCLIPADKDEMHRVLYGLLNAGFLCFIQAMIVSEMVNPIDFSGGNQGRWYGYFLTLGTFGQYLGIQTVFATGSIFLTKKKRGRLHPFYFIGILWLLLVLAAALFCGVTNYMVGIGFLCATLFIFGFGKKKEGYIIRGLIVMLLTVVGGILFLELVKYLVYEYNRDEFLQFVANSPLKSFYATAEVLAFKFEVAHEFKSILFHGKSISATFIESPLLMLLNSLGSGRIFIWHEYLNTISFIGQSGELPIADDPALHAHNEFIQILYEFGFFAGGMYILFYLVSFIGCIAGFIKEKSVIKFMPMISLAMMLGMWTGETSSIHFILTFISTFLLMYFVIFPNKKNKKMANSPENAEKGKIVSRVAIIVLSVLLTGSLGVFGYKLFHDSYDAKRVADQYLCVKTETPEKQDEVVLNLAGTTDTFSREAIEKALGTPETIVTDSEIQRVADKASWTDCVFYSFKLPKEYEPGDRFVIEFTARSENGDKIPLEIMYYKSQNFVSLDDCATRFATVFTVDRCEQRVTLRYPVAAGSETNVIIGDFCLKQYGPEAADEEEASGEDTDNQSEAEKNEMNNNSLE